MKLKLSIVTPSYNQGQYLEHTITSVVDQNYSSLEYIIMDGGSTDNSIEIIKKFGRAITYWASEKDNGQAHAINKGLRMLSGDIVGWINSDDLYTPGTFEVVTEAFKDPAVMWVTGNCEVIDEHEKVTDQYRAEIPSTSMQWLRTLICGYSYSFLQPSTFWRKEVMTKTGLLNELFHYSFDHEFFYRILKNVGPPKVLDRKLSQFRLHSTSKTSSGIDKFSKENRQIGLLHAHNESLKDMMYLYALYLRYRYKNG